MFQRLGPPSHADVNVDELGLPAKRGWWSWEDVVPRSVVAIGVRVTGVEDLPTVSAQ